MYKFAAIFTGVCAVFFKKRVWQGTGEASHKLKRTQFHLRGTQRAPIEIAGFRDQWRRAAVLEVAATI
jgi:hypothetical protein